MGPMAHHSEIIGHVASRIHSTGSIPKPNCFSWAGENFAVCLQVVSCQKIILKFEWDHLVTLQTHTHQHLAEGLAKRCSGCDVCVCVCPLFFVSDCAKIDKSVTLNLKPYQQQIKTIKITSVVPWSSISPRVNQGFFRLPSALSLSVHLSLSQNNNQKQSDRIWVFP